MKPDSSSPQTFPKRHASTSISDIMKVVAAVLALVAGLASANPPIPPRFTGFSQGDPSAPLQIDAFFDFMCPDCRDTWPVLKQVLQKYGSDKVFFRVVPFSLPYHAFSFPANMGGLVAQNLSANPLDWMEAVFANQDSFTAKQQLEPWTQGFQEFGALAAKSLGVNGTTFSNMLRQSNINFATRVSFKYACSRGVSGTPSVMINGMATDANPSWSVNDWTTLLDSVLAGEYPSS